MRSNNTLGILLTQAALCLVLIASAADLFRAHGELSQTLARQRQSDALIARIDARSGEVTAWLDLSHLKTQFQKPAGWIEGEHVLNGIAHDAHSGHYYVTGKCWPLIFVIEVLRQ